MTAKKYPSLKEEEQILWYLLRLEREQMLSEDELYVMSDAAKKQANRLFPHHLKPRKGSNNGSLGEFFHGRKGSYPGSLSPKRGFRKNSTPNPVDHHPPAGDSRLSLRLTSPPDSESDAEDDSELQSQLSIRYFMDSARELENSEKK